MSVVAFGDGPHRAILESAGVTVHIVSGAKPLRVVGVARIARRERTELIVPWHFFTAPYGRVAALVARCRWVPVLQSSLSHEEQTAPGPTALAMKVTDFLLANSFRALDELQARGKPCAYLPNGVDLARFADPSDRLVELRERVRGAAKGRPIVAAIGVLRPEKRFTLFVETLAQLRDDGHQVFGVLVGEGNERAVIERRASELKLGAEHLLLVGNVADVPALLTEVSMTTMTSTTEGTPNVVLEAMAARLPFVTTEVGDAGEIARRSGGGVVAEPTPQAFARALAVWLSDPELRTTAGASGRYYIEEHHALEALPSRFFAAIHR